MSIFGNMMGAYKMGSEMMADSFGGGNEQPDPASNPMTEVEMALAKSNLDNFNPSASQPTMYGMPGATEMDETQMIGSAADGNIPQPESGGGGMIGKTITGQSIAGNIAGLVGDAMTGGTFSQIQDALGAAQALKDGEDPMKAASGFASLFGGFGG
jgi:hypothetical protein